ncbi:hypothetical protein HYX02_06325 [Candidatus Woesearchaeota archaeon]|nr:hypothetical protein [Candidatus Woesearchaeota archaeon]
MVLKFKKGVQKEIICRAITKAGSERKLCKILTLSKGSVYKYKFELTCVRTDRLEKILKFIDEDLSKYKNEILEHLPKNWGQIKGGKNCVLKKIREGTLQYEIERLRKISSKRMKKWHKYMKKNLPKQYHIWQYERFKKVGRGYLYCLDNEIPVRNLLEQKIGNFLIQESIGFEYEPYINVDGKVYFPDFKIDDKIIEVTEWKHPNKDRISHIKKKLKDYNKLGYKVVFFIPSLTRKFYKEFEGSIVSNLPELKKFLTPL